MSIHIYKLYNWFKKEEKEGDILNINNKSKYAVLVDDIKNDINEGRIKNGDKLPSEHELAEMYGMSRHTVRKALSILENEGFVRAEHGRGTFCTISDRGKKRSNTAAVITTYISDYIFPNVINGVYDVMTKNGYNIILKNTKNSINTERKCLQDILETGVDGVIIEPSKSQIFCRNTELYDRLDAEGIPYVFIHGIYPQMQDKPHVVMDDEGGAYKLTQHLAKLGHKRIAGIFKADDSQGTKRHRGYARALKEYGIEYDPETVIWYHTEDRKIRPQAAVKCLTENGVTAIVCYNDQIAGAVIKELGNMGLSVPDDISVTGFDNSAIAEELGITTAVHPKEKIGREAAELLLRLMDGAECRKSIKLDTDIVIRTSSGKPSDMTASDTKTGIKG